MKWKAVTGEDIRRLFAEENYTRNLPTGLVGIYFMEMPTEDKVKVVGQVSCPGCKKWYPFEIDTWVVAEGSALVYCTDSSCRDQTLVKAYRGQEHKKPEDNPLFIFAEPYITKKGQVLAPVALKVSDVIE
jgi:hypothetical protein